MGLVSKIVIAVFLLAILLLPIISGAANVPKSLDPEAIGRFIASWIKYWLSIFHMLIQELRSYNSVRVSFS